jgi:hypothetical protein
MTDNKKLLNQMLPPTYQQNNASVMRTNYPGYFPSDKASRKPEVAPDSKSNGELLVCEFLLEAKYFFNSLFLSKVQTFDRVWEDYKKRTDIERLVPRPFSVVSCKWKFYFNLISINRNEFTP